MIMSASWNCLRESSLAERSRVGRSCHSERSVTSRSATPFLMPDWMASCSGASSLSWSRTRAAPRRAAVTLGRPSPAPSSMTTFPASGSTLFMGGQIASQREKMIAPGQTESPLLYTSMVYSSSSVCVRMTSMNFDPAPGTCATSMVQVSLRAKSTQRFSAPPPPTPWKSSRASSPLSMPPSPANCASCSRMSSGMPAPSGVANMASAACSQRAASSSEMPAFILASSLSNSSCVMVLPPAPQSSSPQSSSSFQRGSGSGAAGFLARAAAPRRCLRSGAQACEGRPRNAARGEANAELSESLSRAVTTHATEAVAAATRRRPARGRRPIASGPSSPARRSPGEPSSTAAGERKPPCRPTPHQSLSRPP
mmetsp:Transcript_28021/g.83489  ORF Transcript_28021/g.83489 Transcript_28021/m.83489 type:complete len:368 (+) Transcript_28021:314-1417(+)